MRNPAVALRFTLPALLLGSFAVLPTGCRPQSPPERQNVYRPENIADTTQLARRQAEQRAAADQFEVFHAFSFTDRLAASGIDFNHKIVDDAGIAYKMLHYDHGNGIAIADVDLDGFYDLYFVNQVGANGLWRNLGDGTFEDITQHAGVGVDSVISVTAAFADIDNDGDPDLFVSAVRDGNFLFENDGAGTFTDISEAAGLRLSRHSSGAVFFDYNRDGLLDLFVTNVGQYTTGEKVPVRGRTRFDDQDGDYSYYVGYSDSTMGKLIPERDETNTLYQNAGANRFVDVTSAMGVGGHGWSGDAVSWDVNEDGWPDLYVLNMNGDDEYYQNEAGQRFVWKTADVFNHTPWGSMGVAVLDYNNDGRIDLYLNDMHSDMYETNRYISPVKEKEKPGRVLPIPHDYSAGTGLNIFGNALFENKGAMTFTDVADRTGAETYWPWGASSGDLNADGYEDLFVTGSMNYPFRYGVNSVLLNNKGERFLDSEFILGVEPRRDNRTAKVWFELDCAVEEHAVCEETGANGPVDVWGSVGSRTSVLFDVENDGDLDIVTGEFNDEPMVLLSNLSAEKPDLRFAKVKLVGTTSNREGLGATVQVHAGATTYTKAYTGASGYLSHSSYPLYFGLGDAEAIDRIDVRWPSGQQQVVQGPLETNQLIEIEEP